MSKRQAEYVLWRRSCDELPKIDGGNVFLLNPLSLIAKTYPHLVNTPFVSVVFCTSDGIFPIHGTYFPGALVYRWYGDNTVSYPNFKIVTWAYDLAGPDIGWRRGEERYALKWFWNLITGRKK